MLTTLIHLINLFDWAFSTNYTRHISEMFITALFTHTRGEKVENVGHLKSHWVVNHLPD